MKNNVKKFICGTTMGILLLTQSITVFADTKKISVSYPGISIYVNKDYKNSEKEPFMYEGTTYVPLRFVSENLGATVSWDGDTNSIYIVNTGEVSSSGSDTKTSTSGSTTKTLEVNYSDIKVYVDGELKSSEQEPFMYEGTTYVPLRFISESLGSEVTWVGDTKSIYLEANSSTNVSDTTTNNDATTEAKDENGVEMAEPLFMISLSEENSGTLATSLGLSSEELTTYLGGNNNQGAIGQPDGEPPTGEKPDGEPPTGEIPTGEIPDGEPPTGEIPTGEIPTGEPPTGEIPTDNGQNMGTPIFQETIDSLVSATSKTETEVLNILKNYEVSVNK